jgi:uncharacterized protein (DUF2235 family)
VAVIQRFRHWWRGHPAAINAPAAVPPPGRVRGVVDHIILLDGTFSTLQVGQETNIGLMFKLLTEGGPSAHRNVYYEPGLQWEGWRHGWAIIQGHGFDSLIRRAYGWLASHYRPGDRIFLFGYSRGAYAVRSLAGVIDRVGLLKREHATERGVTLTYRHYMNDPGSTASRAFAQRFCHDETAIEMVGVFDTVKSLGIKWPLLWLLIKDKTEFHNHHLGGSIRHGFHALALHETRNAFAPVLWECPPGWEGNIEQVWFRGAHGDVGGQVGDNERARPLANIPLVWMLDRAATVGLPLPQGWQDRFDCDPNAPMVGTIKSWGKWFIIRRKRRSLRDISERLHPTAMSPPTGQRLVWFARQV